MKHDTLTSGGRPDRSTSFSASVEVPAEVFYVVQSNGALGERDHHLRSDLYETRLQADSELSRLRAANSGESYGVWKSATYIEPAEWRHRVVRFDGTLVLPRLRDAEKSTGT
jgi:hypothetical protein